MDQNSAFMVAYLALHGWDCGGEDAWSKPGVSQVELRTGSCGRGCNCNKLREETVTEFGLNAAYWIERERQDAVRSVMES